ncbi:YciI family protein [Mesorhizobium sp.]|uniref:YciI family protein n=1 Tax=Mesorhizobium sp. TaxID=1871066 RepID=UPI003BAB416E
MQYLLLIYNSEAGMAAAPREAAIQMSAAYGAYTEAMKKAGVFVGGERLRFTSTATSVRVAGGKTNVIDGPYADTKEQLGGYYMIDVPDMDEAISWAARCPGASTGTMEVRPVWPMAEYMTEYTS